MMRPRDAALYSRIERGLEAYERRRQLPGIERAAARHAFIEQLLESVHRVEFVKRLGERQISPLRADPASPLYDPLKAAVVFKQQGLYDEACWQVFLAVHFGKHGRSGWLLVKDIYGRLGQGPNWSWDRIGQDLPAFIDWLRQNKTVLIEGNNGVRRGFSNHRKYQSISADKPNGTGHAIASYVQWVADAHGHKALFESALQAAEFDPRVAFALLFEQMDAVRSFGRIAKFDYLTMIGKLRLADIEPNSAYIAGSTGPLAGAKLLFDETAARSLDQYVQELGDALDLNMQVMEDAICNWQKSPERFVAFRG